MYFPDLENEKNEIHNIIAKFVDETLVPQIKLTNCVVDFVLVKENDVLKVSRSNSHIKGSFTRAACYLNMNINTNMLLFQPYVIELNPFAEFAGGGLFNWVDDMDVLIGRKPFEFRIGKEIAAFALQSISADWRPFVFV